VVQFGLVDNEYLVRARTPRGRRCAEGDVAIGGETDLARGAFDHLPHDVNQSVATTAAPVHTADKPNWSGATSPEATPKAPVSIRFNSAVRRE
jgi:hypothetical protein